MLIKSKFFKPVSLCLAIVTLVESLIFGGLSLLCILLYNGVIISEPNNKSMNQFTVIMHDLYLSATAPIPYNHRVVIPSTFYILTWIYFILSLLLGFISAVHITVLCTNSEPKKTKISTIVWQSLTYIVCLFDLITSALFGFDYQMIKDYINEDTASKELYLIVSITLCILAAKGIILWIFNFIVSVIVTMIFRKKVEEEEEIISQENPGIYTQTY